MAIAESTLLARLSTRINASRLPAAAPAQAVRDSLARLQTSYAEIEDDWQAVAVIESAVAILARALSASYAPDSDASIGSDAVDTTSSSEEYRLIAEAAEALVTRLRGMHVTNDQVSIGSSFSPSTPAVPPEPRVIGVGNRQLGVSP